MSTVISRRRFITFLAVAACLPMLLRNGGAQARPGRWDGTALGAPASIQLSHTDEALARAAIAAGLDELKRLETIFSVYRADSSISKLNREGVLENAPDDFIAMLTRSLSLAKISDGVYDPTVQPLWQTYFRHFTASNPDPAGPAQRDLAAALALVDWRAVEVDAGNKRISFARPGLGLTVNRGAAGCFSD